MRAMYHGTNLNTVPNDASLINYDDEKNVKEALDFILEEMSTSSMFVGTTEEIQEAIDNGDIKEGDSAKATDDYGDDFVGNIGDIADIGNGTICGAIDALNSKIANKVEIKTVRYSGTSNANGNMIIPSTVVPTNAYIISVKADNSYCCIPYSVIDTAWVIHFMTANASHGVVANTSVLVEIYYAEV